MGFTPDFLKQGESTFPFYHTPQATQGLSIDIVDACNLQCPTCPRGLRYMKNRRQQMSFELFTSILDKAARLGFHYIDLYNWTEPFLCRDLPRYTAHVKTKGLFCKLSSNLSFPHLPHLIPALASCDKLIVSVSGFQQETYRVNHRGGNIAFVKNNLKKIAEAKRRGDIHTNVVIRYFNFDYSEAEYPQFEAFAKDLGLDILLWHGNGNPHAAQSPLADYNEKAWLARETHNQSLALPTSIPGKACRVSIVPVTVDCRGDVFLCCSKPNFAATRVGNFLEDDFDLIQYLRLVHPLCAGCTVRKDVDMAPYHAASLLRGLTRSLGVSADFLEEAAREAAVAANLAGREVYFWGHGGMFRRKRHVFAACRVRCVLSDMEDAPALVDGFPVRHPDEVLKDGELLPIVIFGGREAQERIAQTIREKWPEYREIFFCSTT